MSITDELREYVEEQIKWLDMTKVHYRKLFAIADRIDEQNAEAQRRWMVKLDAENSALISPKLLRHHKQPTVEDVLEQFAVEVERAGGAFDVADDVWARFAAKLRLAESEGE